MYIPTNHTLYQVLSRAKVWPCVQLRLVNPIAQEAGIEMVNQVREGLRQRMMEVDWLDDETRQLAVEKVCV